MLLAALLDALVLSPGKAKVAEAPAAPQVTEQ